jgi:hypothetical protein
MAKTKNRSFVLTADKRTLHNIGKAKELLDTERKKRSPEEYVKFLELIATSFLLVLPEMWSHTDAEIEEVSKLLAKYIGKKVSPERMDLYNEIQAVDNEKMADGQDSNFKQSAKVVSKRHHLTARQSEKLYKSFIEWKNKQLKIKSTIDKPS